MLHRRLLSLAVRGRRIADSATETWSTGAVRDMALSPGVEAVDNSGAESSGEVRLLATANPELLRRRLHKAPARRSTCCCPPAKSRAPTARRGDLLDDAAL
jgi:hypothetical protein